jgi:hypothetical protein
MGAGFLSDNISIDAPWLAGAIIGVVAVLSFLSLRKLETHTP